MSTYFQSYIGSDDSVSEGSVPTRKLTANKKEDGMIQVEDRTEKEVQGYNNYHPNSESIVDNEREYLTDSNDRECATSHNEREDEDQDKRYDDDEEEDELENQSIQKYDSYGHYETEDHQQHDTQNIINKENDYTEKFDDGNHSSEWRVLQQQFLKERMNQKSSRSAMRDPSPMVSRQRSNIPVNNSSNISKVGDRLYNYAAEMKRRHDSRIKAKKEEEEAYKPRLVFETKRSKSNLRSQSVSKSESDSRGSSTPRYEHLYNQGIMMNNKKKALKKKEEEEMKQRKLRLESRPSSRARQSTSVPRYMHLYERAKTKQEATKTREAKKSQVVRKNVTTPQRIDRLYSLSVKSQQEGRQRREQIEKEKQQKKLVRSESVGRRSVTAPLDVRLYNNGIAQMKKMEIKRAAAAAARDDDTFKSPLLNKVSGKQPTLQGY